jgi:hypothetical protein
MFRVMDLHCARVDVRFERVVGVCQFWKFECHDRLLVGIIVVTTLRSALCVSRYLTTEVVTTLWISYKEIVALWRERVKKDIRFLSCLESAPSVILPA